MGLMTAWAWQGAVRIRHIHSHEGPAGLQTPGELGVSCVRAPVLSAGVSAQPAPSLEGGSSSSPSVGSCMWILKGMKQGLPCHP